MNKFFQNRCWGHGSKKNWTCKAECPCQRQTNKRINCEYSGNFGMGESESMKMYVDAFFLLVYPNIS